MRAVGSLHWLHTVSTPFLTWYYAHKRRGRKAMDAAGILPDFNLYNDLTIRECLTFFARAYGVDPCGVPARVEAVLDSSDLREKADDFVRHLSRGMVQRLGVAALMVHDPDLFLLDEPASGLDPIARVQLRSRVASAVEPPLCGGSKPPRRGGFTSYDERGAFRLNPSVQLLRSCRS